MPQQFTGIAEKLDRASENIRNLDFEISRFFQESKYPVLPEHDRELLLEAIQYHKHLVIPPRFSVLTGEVVHHLRSCLDHIVWHFSVEQYRIEHTRSVEFPIFDKRPIDTDTRRRYERKVKGITDPNVVTLIERLQPYNAADPIDTPLFTINNFDIVDKHRELVLCSPTATRRFPIELQGIVETYQSAHPELTRADVALKLKGQGNLLPYVSFRNFGLREIQPVIPGLIELFNYTVGLVEEFAQF